MVAQTGAILAILMATHPTTMELKFPKIARSRGRNTASPSFKLTSSMSRRRSWRQIGGTLPLSGLTQVSSP